MALLNGLGVTPEAMDRVCRAGTGTNLGKMAVAARAAPGEPATAAPPGGGPDGAGAGPAVRAVCAFREPGRSTLLWLLDLMADVVARCGANKMTAKNMSIVLSPNLLQVETENPMVAITVAQQVADYTLALLEAYTQRGGDMLRGAGDDGRAVRASQTRDVRDKFTII